VSGELKVAMAEIVHQRRLGSPVALDLTHMLTAISGIADRRELAKHAFGVGSLLCEAAAPKGIRA
jgi:hypothetical protein